MNHIYALKALSSAEEYIHLEGDFARYKIPCMKSEIQFLDREETVFTVSKEGGFEIPDMICQEGIVFLSGRVKQLLDEVGADYVFYKKVHVVSHAFGIHETYWMTVPPRIDCISLEDSILKTDWDFEDGIIPELEAEKIILSLKMVGRFQIFKIMGVRDNNIYVTQKLYDKLHSVDLEGMEYMLLQ